MICNAVKMMMLNGRRNHFIVDVAKVTVSRVLSGAFLRQSVMSFVNCLVLFFARVDQGDVGVWAGLAGHVL